MYTSLSLTSDSLAEEVPPKSSLPWVWFGFFFVAAFLIEETLAVVLELDDKSTQLVLIVIGIAGIIYWFFCVHRFHKVLGEISRRQYPIGAGEAVGKSFIPFYNLVWFFTWCSTMSEYLNRHERVRMVSGNLLGLILLISTVVTRFFDGGLGLTGMFVVGLYMSAKLHKHVESIGGVSKDLLPPQPDPGLFAPAAMATQHGDPQPTQGPAESASAPLRFDLSNLDSD